MSLGIKNDLPYEFANGMWRVPVFRFLMIFMVGVALKTVDEPISAVFALMAAILAVHTDQILVANAKNLD